MIKFHWGSPKHITHMSGTYKTYTFIDSDGNKSTQYYTKPRETIWPIVSWYGFELKNKAFFGIIRFDKPKTVKQ